MIILRKNSNIEDQREFGYITSKITRPLRAKIGKGRKKLAEKLTKSADKDVKRNIKVNDIMENYSYEHPDSNALNKLVKRELDTGVKEGYVSSYKDSFGDASFNRNTKEIISELDEPATVLHELGHAKIQAGKEGKINQLIQDRPIKYRHFLSNEKENKIKESVSSKKNKNKEKGSFYQSLKDTVQSAVDGALTVHTERTASKSALKDLKRLGKEVIDKDRESLSINGKISDRNKKWLKKTQNDIERIISNGKRVNNLALESYVSGAKKDVKLNAANLVNIPSRRVK